MAFVDAPLHLARVLQDAECYPLTAFAAWFPVVQAMNGIDDKNDGGRGYVQQPTVTKICLTSGFFGTDGALIKKVSGSFVRSC